MKKAVLAEIGRLLIEFEIETNRAKKENPPTPAEALGGLEENKQGNTCNKDDDTTPPDACQSLEPYQPFFKVNKNFPSFPSLREQAEKQIRQAEVKGDFGLAEKHERILRALKGVRNG